MILTPVRVATENVYLFIYAVTGNYGIALLVLSGLSFVLMSGLMAFVGKFAARETKLQEILGPQLRKIKQESRGRERHDRIAGLYRRYRYHPILALRSLVPVFVQLPFLFAAYFMLSELEDIHNQSFLFIRDLSAPDALLAGLNLLPILMTVANIGTALITRGFGTREKVQAGVIAVMFFVLLYSKSSALLLFWTTNNVISLTKTALGRARSKPIAVPRLAGLWRNIAALNREKPFYPVVVGLYPVVYLYTHNIKDTSFSELLLPLGVNAALTGLCFALGFALFRKGAVAACFAATGMIALFYYRYSLQKLAGTLQIGSHAIQIRNPVLVLIWAVALAAAFLALWRLERKRRVLTRILPLLNTVSAFVFVVLLSQIGLYFGSELVKKSGRPAHEPIATNVSDEVRGGYRPDIYYVILDGYASNSGLSRYYGYDNRAFTDALAKRGFFVAKGARSNYANTYLSLCASLNMEYVQSLGLSLDPQSDDRTDVYAEIENNRVVQAVKRKGYKYVLFQTGWGGVSEHADVLYRSSSGEFVTLWLNTSTLYYFTRKLGIGGELRKSRLEMFERLARVREIDGPKFVFAHIVLPHPPYLFGPDGEQVGKSAMLFDGAVWKQKDKYIDQLRFVNKKVMALLDAMLSDPSYAPVIILQADHGSASSFADYDHATQENIDERTRILNAVYLPKGDYRGFYDTMSPVNEFRVLFNAVFGDAYPLLPDRAYYSSYRYPYKFQEAVLK